MINDSKAGPRVIGSLRAEDGAGVVRMEDRYATDIDDLWSALTEPSRLARWIAQVDGDLRLGGQFHARFTSGWVGAGRVEVCDPPRSMVAAFLSDDQDESVIEAWLFDEGEQTRLVIEERGLPLGELALHGAGWQVHIEDLAAYLEGREQLNWKHRWTELAPTYSGLAEDLAATE
jgi:uncharacterized protein YndB with AHSA1/START domain